MNKMNTIEDFVNSNVRIEYIESAKCYGHYPFQLYVERPNGEREYAALALGGNVTKCYGLFAKNKKLGAKKIYMSLDFPAIGDIKNDFVAIYSMEQDQLKINAISYDTESGNVIDKITKSECLDNIKEQLERYF